MYNYTEDQFENAVKEAIRRCALDYYHSSPTTPSFIIVGGQTGACKSDVIDQIIRDIPDFHFIVNTNELRRFHPYYGLIQHEQGINTAQYTHEFASRLKMRLVEYLRDRKVTFGLQSTFSDPDSDTQLCQDFKKAGYEVQAHVLSVPEEISNIKATSRYIKGRERTEVTREGYVIRAGRYVPTDIRDHQYSNIPLTLKQLTSTPDTVDYVGVYNVEGDSLYIAGSRTIRIRI